MSQWRDECGYGMTDREQCFRKFVGREPSEEFATAEEIKRAREKLFPPKEAKEVRPPVDRARADRIHDSGKADFL